VHSQHSGIKVLVPYMLDRPVMSVSVGVCIVRMRPFLPLVYIIYIGKVVNAKSGQWHIYLSYLFTSISQ
jgi:hypothetical protein